MPTLAGEERVRAAAAPLGCSFCVLCLLAGYVPTDDKTLNTGSLARSVDLNHPLPPASSPSPCAPHPSVPNATQNLARPASSHPVAESLAACQQTGARHPRRSPCSPPTLDPGPWSPRDARQALKPALRHSSPPPQRLLCRTLIHLATRPGRPSSHRRHSSTPDAGDCRSVPCPSRVRPVSNGGKGRRVTTSS